MSVRSTDKKIALKWDMWDFKRTLAKANEQLEFIGSPQIVKPYQEFKEIPLDDEYKLAFNAFKGASVGIQGDLTRLFLPMFSMLISFTALFNSVSSSDVQRPWAVKLFFVFIVAVIFYMHFLDSKKVGAQAIVDEILEHRKKEQESTNGAPSTQNTGTEATDIDPKLKQTILEALQEHHTHHPQNTRPRGFKIFFPPKNK